MPEFRPLISTGQVRAAFLLGGVGSVGLILGILILATARPQGNLVRVDDTQHLTSRAAAREALSGFELIGDGARIDIETAMALVVERGVDATIHPGGVPAAP